jgi:arylsulfatase A-like enzyme
VHAGKVPLVDVAPTLCGLLGVAPAPTMVGKALEMQRRAPSGARFAEREA